jgi:RNA polymerase sigma factor (sigma-70 family)
MGTRRRPTVLQRLREVALRPDGAGLTDGELLERFLVHRDEDAFAALVRRHGPVVLGVCRRLLQNEADADDAFQATFLVLVRKADSIRPPGMVGNWLYGVAHNTARKARALSARRRSKEREWAALPRPSAPEEAGRQGLVLLDRELRALPDKYRAPIILCDLEGHTLQEAARQLGWPLGTVGTRRARGRALLARRLARHGLAPAGGTLAALVVGPAPATLVAGSVQAAGGLAAGRALTSGVVSVPVATLTQGVLRMMLLTKLKRAMALLLAAVLACCGAGVLVHGVLAAGQAGSARQAQDEPPQPPPAPPQGGLRSLIDKAVKAHGGQAKVARWRTTRLKMEGKLVAQDQEQPLTLLETWRLPGEYRSETTVERRGVTTTSIGVLGKDKGWLALTTGQTVDLDKEGTEILRDSAVTQGLGLLALLSDEGNQLASSGEAPVNGREAVGVLVKSSVRRDLRLYFDKDSGLLLSEVHSSKLPGEDKRTLQQVYFSDYQEKDGVKYPRRIVLYGDGVMTIDAKVTDLEFPAKVDDKLFAKP